MTNKKKIVLVGGGASSLFCAGFLDAEQFDIHIYEKNKACARKFLVAGDGGFNLTHSETNADFVERYTPSSFLKESLEGFTNVDFQNYLSEIGIPTFVGTSGRVYPEKGIKPIAVLDALVEALKNKGVVFHFNQEWKGWSDKNALLFNDDEEVEADLVIFALGGASWTVTGSDGTWTSLFAKKDLNILPFEASNCAFGIEWDADYLKQFDGKPLKNIEVSINGKKQKGEAVVTTFGLEGNALYALSPEVRKALKDNSEATISIDFKPMLSVDEIVKKLKLESKKGIGELLKNELKLHSQVISLLKNGLSKEEYLDVRLLAKRIKAYEVKVNEMASIEESISTVGGLDLEELTPSFELKKLPNHYCIGEMSNWDAPTGGYLLQACASMGVKVARGLN